MSKTITGVFSFVLIIAALLWGLYGSMPQHVSLEALPETQFSTGRAYRHVEAIAQQPHYLGSPAHSRVRNYIVSELQEMGLLVHTQENYSLSKGGTFTRPQNILARLEGTGEGRALLLLSHYDSAVHSSYGASDAASGVATILEGVRAFMASGQTHENDIIILFTDGEELGLNGAEAFVRDHEWADEIGLALNFEARGSGGSSFMLLETNSGNRRLIREFVKADVQYPVTNSLAYSVYKMLPNDTDLTVLRERGNINGLNFAFIDDHFDYHTATDVPENLDIETLAHQGSYLMPLLRYFSSEPLEYFEAGDDLIYFNFPGVKMAHYPFSWNIPLLVIAVLLFLALLIYGFYWKRLRFRGIIKGFVPALMALVGAGVLAWAFWQFCLFIYPQYLEMEHGFTYNGYWYIAAVIFLGLAISFGVYERFRKPDNVRELFVAPLFFWLLLSAATAFFLEGAAYFIIPVYLGLIQFFLLLKQKKPNLILLTLLSLPVIFIVLPFMTTFPVALGLRILFVSAILVVLVFMIFWPIFGFYRKNQTLAFFSFLTFFVLVLLAHFRSDFSEERPKPNSLVYLLDEDLNRASWNTYDELMDSWTEPYFNGDLPEYEVDAVFSSKYNSGFSRSVEAPMVEVSSSFVQVQKNDGAEGLDEYTVKIVPQRRINRIELFADRRINFEEFRVNGLEARPVSEAPNAPHLFKNRWSDRLLTYYVANNDTLRLEMSLKAGIEPEIAMYEASHDLLQNEQLQVPPRDNDMIPRPFVLNDAVVVKKTIRLE